MNTFTKARLACVAMLVLPVAVAMSCGAAQAQSAPDPMNATYVCRPAMANETASAKMVADSSLLVCHPVAISMKMNDGTLKTIGSVSAKPSGPDLTNANTPQQINDAWNRWIVQQFHIDRSP